MNTIEYVLSYLVSYGILGALVGIGVHMVIFDKPYANAKSLTIGLLWPLSFVVLLLSLFWRWVTKK